ncbi:MAG TPA: protein kinase [Gemmatimonadales bacterium]|nr:protein kinase [Gemmatimonadales bacterium]
MSPRSRCSGASSPTRIATPGWAKSSRSDHQGSRWPDAASRRSLGQPPEGLPIELAARLQSLVGGSYRIRRELGGGAMSRVFLAEETRLGRQVVIKLLPPEMGAGVNVERFEREIQFAARLQHPHIVPLLTAGAEGDLLYYVMPFIQGESLRVKLAREGELPVTEAVRILREVVDALAYAHRNGVVHRDIKPDNILVADGHAVVTDFGVAKAVSASSGGSLTSLGVALGTPAYMAPEQAAADPHVDHRADIYAVGVLGYEMLCGRPPFVEPTPQALLAAHITRPPEPVTRFRPSVSPQLEGLIARCLAKRAADRWQTAAELVQQLESMTTPSAGTAPIGTQPVVSSGTEAAIRRAHPARVALLFAAASALVLAIVSFLMYRLGLPDWVLWGAGVLLLIGLPIMLLTSLHERRRAIARTTAVITPQPTGLARWFTWRKALLGGGLAFAALAAVAGAYTAMRLLGIGPIGTLVAAGALEERGRLILADFDNRAADSTLGASLTEAFRVDLSQSRSVRLVGVAELGDVLRRMQRPADATLTPTLAREVAERSGVRAVVTGQIDPVGSGYVLSASLLSAADGRVLAAVRETADQPSGLLAAIDRLSGKLRERIGESLVTIRAGQPLQRVTTGSLAALRKYSEAVRLDDLGRSEEAVPVLEEAIALDTGFAMAYRKLAVALSKSGGSQHRITTAATQAYQRRDRLPDVERELTTAYYHTNADYDETKAAAAYRSALTLDPDNGVALNNLSIILQEQRRYAAAESLATRAIQIEKSVPYFDNALASQIAQGRFTEARATLEALKRALPESPATFYGAWMLAAAERKHAEAERVLEAMREQERASPSLQAFASWGLALLAEQRGRIGEAARHLRAFMAQSEARGETGEYLRGATDLALLELQYRNRPEEALAIVSQALARRPLDSIPAMNRPYLSLAVVQARAGRPQQARRYLREYETAVPAGVRRAARWQGWVYGEVAEAEGRPREAMEAYRRVYEENGICGICGLFELARVHDRQGDLDSARVILERSVDTPTMFRWLEDPHSLAPSYKRLGELYEAKGDRKKAADWYARFVELWKDADPELQPGVREVRQRLARLAQEPGS